MARKVFAFFKVRALGIVTTGRARTAVIRPVITDIIIGTSRFSTTRSGGTAVGCPVFTGGFIGTGSFRTAS